MKKITAVIVTHNNQDTIKGCISSLRRCGISEIVVVDNSSVDKTAISAANTGVRVISTNTNNGFGAGINTGVKQIQDDVEYLFFMSPDGQLLGVLNGVIDRFEQTEKLGVVGLRLEDAQGNAEKDGFGKEPTILQIFLRKMQGAQETNRWQSTDWVSGGAMIISKELFRALGGFDEEFFLYWEDIDLCHRARQMGYMVQFCPTAGVRHLRGHSLTDKRQKTRIFDSSADRYFQKHYAAPIWIFQRFSRFLYRLVSPQVR